MATLDEILTNTKPIEDYLLNGLRLGDLVHDKFKPTVKIKPYQRKFSRKFYEDFSLEWEEFLFTPKEVIWENYVKVLLKRLVLDARALAKKHKTRVRFYRFDIEPDTMNRKTYVLDRDGVFFAMRVRRRGISPCLNYPEKVQDIVEFEMFFHIGKN